MMNEKYRTDMVRQKERVAFDLKELIAGTEALLQSTASYTGAEIEDARGRLREQLSKAKDEASRLNTAALERARQLSEATDEYVHEHPWRLLAAAALVGVVVGHCLRSDK